MCEVNDPLDLAFIAKLIRSLEFAYDPCILLVIIGLGIVLAVRGIAVKVTRLVRVCSENEHITHLVAVACTGSVSIVLSVRAVILEVDIVHRPENVFSYIMVTCNRDDNGVHQIVSVIVLRHIVLIDEYLSVMALVGDITCIEGSNML